MSELIDRLDALYGDHNAWAEFMDAMEDEWPTVRNLVLRLEQQNHALLEALKDVAGYAPIPIHGEAVCIFCQGSWDNHEIRAPQGKGTIGAEDCEWVAAHEAIAKAEMTRGGIEKQAGGIAE